ncbi:MAG: adenosylcobinamide-GDP ribazoletransferase [Phormidesmis sp.]
MKAVQSARRLWLCGMRALAGWHGALMFYTCLPVPQDWPLEFRWIARWVPWVGLVVGGLLAIADQLLSALQMPALVASALVIAFGMAITGGLHVDGVMDVADGLAVPDSSRRLAVMSDSHMGAFGGMAAIVLVLLKVVALAAIAQHRVVVLVAVAMWGRWAQQWAIARYPYLKKEGKGAFHKAALPTIWHSLPHLLGLLGLSGFLYVFGWAPADLLVRISIGGILFSWLTGAYFYRQLGGHTGDTYGAVVEWSEALLLCSLSASF